MVFLTQMLERVKPFGYVKKVYASDFWGNDRSLRSLAANRRKTFLMSAHFVLRRRTSPKVAHIAYLKSLQRMSSNLHAKREDAVKLKDARVEAGLNELNFDLWHWNDALTKSHIHLDDGMSANLAIFEPRTFRALTAVAAHKAMTPAQAGGLGLPPCGPGIEVIKTNKW